VNTDTFDNLTPVERIAPQNVRSNEDIIIKQADICGAVVVTDKSAYIREAERQLSDVDPKASSEIIQFLQQFGLVDGTRN
jgi:hypothetical protein